MTKYMKIFKILMFIIICELVGIAGSFFTVSSIGSWYIYLNKPVFNPPNWVFGPVWTILYALMGYSAYRIWTKGIKKEKVGNAKEYFIFQLVLNAIWTPVFFGSKDLLMALVIIAVLWLLILKTILLFYKLDKISAYLLIPYLLWVSFATILNFSLWYLNK